MARARDAMGLPSSKAFARPVAQGQRFLRGRLGSKPAFGIGKQWQRSWFRWRRTLECHLRTARAPQHYLLVVHISDVVIVLGDLQGTVVTLPTAA